MGFFGRIKTALFGGGVPSPYGMLNGLFITGQAPRRGSKEMLEAYKRLPWLHSVVTKIARDVSAVQFKLYAPTSRREEKSKRIRRDALGAYVGSAPLAEVEQHAFLDVLANPNPALGKLGTFFLLSAYLDVKGEVPNVIERASDGKPLELWPVPAHWLQSGPSATQDFWRFQFSGWYAQVAREDVLYMREPDLTNPYGRGTGQGDALADELDIDEFAAQHIKSWFYNRALPDAFIQMEGVESEVEARKWEEKLREKHQGVGRGNQIHVSNGKLDVKVISQTFKDQQLSELRSQQRDMILQTFNVPPEVMGIIENSNRATIDAADYLYKSGVVMPRANAISSWLTTLAREWSGDFVVLPANVVPEDREFNLKVMVAQPELFTKNEWRKAACKEPVAGWDDEFVDKPAPPPAFGGGPPGEEDPSKVKPDPSNEPADDEEGKAAQRGRLLPLRSRADRG